MFQTCPRCAPRKRVTHLINHIQYYGSLCAMPIAVPSRAILGRRRIDRMCKAIWNLILDACLLMGVARARKDWHALPIRNRSTIFLHEAKKRDIDIAAITISGKCVNEFRFIFRGKRYYYEHIPLAFRSFAPEIDDKYAVKKILSKHGVPVPEGERFRSAGQARAYGNACGYPLVVKPSHGSLSHHATYPVADDAELTEAIAIAKQYEPEILVEKYLKGTFYRATVIGKKEVFVCVKEPANVIGDGVSTLRDLIARKNEDPLRGEAGDRSRTLHKIPVDAALVQRLANQGISLDSILEENRKLYLTTLVTLASGTDIIGCTKIAHPDNLSLFLEIARVLQTDLVGIDYICQTIEEPYTKQDAGVIEVNSMPYIDMHLHPSHGKPDPVAERVWEVLLKML